MFNTNLVIIILTIFFAFSLYLILKNTKSKQEKFEKDIFKKAIFSDEVCLVGNGPLSEEDRIKINNCKQIIRFNSVKNFKEGERIDVHTVRCSSAYFLRDLKMLPDVPKIIIFTNKKEIQKYRKQLKKYKLLTPIFTYEPGRSDDMSYMKDQSIFDKCNMCLNNECKYSNTISGVSTGTVVINHLESLHNIKKIYVFGMNWNGEHAHLDFANPEIVPKCCRKCIIHKTATKNYI